jgi:hypothetical protein
MRYRCLLQDSRGDCRTPPRSVRKSMTGVARRATPRAKRGGLRRSLRDGYRGDRDQIEEAYFSLYLIQEFDKKRQTPAG